MTKTIQRDRPKPAPQPSDAETRIRRQQTIRVVLSVALAAAFAAVALDNTKTVAVGWVFGQATMPLLVALLATFALGAFIGAVRSRRHHR